MRVFLRALGATMFGAALGVASAQAQVTLDTVTGGVASEGLRPNQQGPRGPENVIADRNAEQPIGATGANNDREAGVNGITREDMRVQNQNQASSRIDARAGSGGMSNTWRYARSNGHWWYYMPSGAWVFRYGDRWVPYNAATYGQYYPTAANSPNPAAIVLPNSRFQAANPGSGPSNPINNGLGGTNLNGGSSGAGAGFGSIMNGSGAMSNGGSGVPPGMLHSGGAGASGATNAIASPTTPGAAAASGSGGGPGSPNTGYRGLSPGSTVGVGAGSPLGPGSAGPGGGAFGAGNLGGGSAASPGPGGVNGGFGAGFGGGATGPGGAGGGAGGGLGGAGGAGGAGGGAGGGGGGGK